MQKLLLTLMLLSGLAKAQFTTTNVITGLPYPVVLEIAPDGRFFISCKGGSGFGGPPADAEVRVFSSTGAFQATLWDFTDSVETYFERGVLGVTCDPDFNTNHYVYVFYNHASPAMIRVVRFTESGGVGSSPTVIFEVDDPNAAGNHTGGNIHFRPSDPDHLYISIGDRADNNDNAQDLGRWEGKILRIHKNGSIPTDNPFYDDGNPDVGNDDRIWSYGLRNTFDFDFSLVNDSLYGAGNGQNSQDEVNLVGKGKNYGWPYCEGTLPYEGSCTGYEAPLATFGVPLPSVTGIMHYSSSLMPAYTNHLIVTDYNDGNVWDLELGNAPAYNTLINKTKITALSSFSSLIDIEQGLEGCWYIIDGGYTASGELVKVCPTGMSVEEQTVQPFQMYPNPATEVVVITGINVEQILVLDMNGKIVLTSNASRVDVSTLPNGVYQFQVNGRYFQKLIKL